MLLLKDAPGYQFTAPFEHWPPRDIAGIKILTGKASGIGRTVIADIEADGLLHQQGEIGQASFKREATQFWCIAAVDVVTGEEFYWGVDLGPESLGYALMFLSECRMALAHNGIGFDYPASEKLYGWKRPELAWDTLVLAKMVWPYDVLIGPDMRLKNANIMPGRLVKSHSLEAWGYRTGTHKQHYTGGFDAWSPDMAAYLMQDIRSTLVLWQKISAKIGWLNGAPDPENKNAWSHLSLWTENEVARIIHEQHEFGIRFDIERAVELTRLLQNAQAELDTKLVDLFGSWWQPLDDRQRGTRVNKAFKRKLTEFPDVVIERYSEKTGKRLKPYVGPPKEEFSEDAPFVRIEWTTFKPASRDHLGIRLQEVYGWKPKAFGKDGKPTVDESTLEQIPDAVMPADVRKLILDYFVVSKTLGTLSKGRNAWLRLVREDGRIHGTMDTCGAVTRRGTHKHPNLSACPKVITKKGDDGAEHAVLGLDGKYGYECRELFLADEGWEQTGIDASALELIDLGHYLVPFDGGAFRDRVCDPLRDPHKEHAEISGLTRADAKTAIYLKVYGGSAYKLSLSTKVEDGEIPRMLSYKGMRMLLRALEKRFGPEFVAKLDDAQRARISKARQIIIKLESGIKGLAELIEGVQLRAERDGGLKALDGTRIHVRKAFAALNSLLQSAGAISCKLWMALCHQELRRRGLKLGVDFKQVLWVHDELQFTHKPGLAPVIKEVAEASLVRAGELLGLRGRYRTDAKTGSNWAECH